MDLARLDELERLLAEATPGPWGARIGSTHADDVWVASDAERPWEDHMGLKLWVRQQTNGNWLQEDNRSGRQQAEGNARFIAAAVNALPDLLADARNWQRVVERGDAIVERMGRAMAAEHAYPEESQYEDFSRLWHGLARAALAAITESDDGA